MTAIVIANTIAAALVIAGLAVAMRFGHLTAGGRLDRTLRRFDVHRGEAVTADQTELRRAA
jgi:hypothetical protein